MNSFERTSNLQAARPGLSGHDLGQSMHVIGGAYEHLRTRARTSCGHARQEHGERAISGLTGQLDRLAGALRFCERGETMETSSVAIAPLFWRLCHENEDAALRRGIDLRASSTGAHVISNPVLLGGIIRSLVSNLVKHTEPGGRILIGCRRCDRDVRIDVYDTGIGVAPERLSRIFDALQRLDCTPCDGLGLGLFVVRRALELLGHRIEVRSLLAQGTRFSLFAPRSRE